MFFGVGQSKIAATFAGSIPIPDLETRKPTNVISYLLNSHFWIMA